MDVGLELCIQEMGHILCSQPTLKQVAIHLSHRRHKIASFLGGSAYNVGDPGSIPGLGRPPGEGNGNPLQYSCLENPMDGGTW